MKITVEILQRIGQKLARYLSKPLPGDTEVATSTAEILAASLMPGDVLLVAGSSRFSIAIKYLTQSSWSHSALYIGSALGPPRAGEEALVLIEADVNDGIRAVPLSEYSHLHTRICRPVGLSANQISSLCAYAVARLGQRYDLKNIIDLARYLIPTPFLPTRWRRRLLALGSGDPTLAICSSLIAQAFQSVRYPILPEVRKVSAAARSTQEILHIRHHSLFTPRDFDVSPYFQIIKPTIEKDFDPAHLNWGKTAELDSA